MRIDWRSLWTILTLPAKAYVLFLVFVSTWNGIALFRHSHLLSCLRTDPHQSAGKTHAALAALQRNLRELLFLTLLFFGFAFFTELISGIRGWCYSSLNPQADVVAPFDTILVVSQLSFGVFTLMQCIRWFMSARLERVLCKR